MSAVIHSVSVHRVTPADIEVHTTERLAWAYIGAVSLVPDATYPGVAEHLAALAHIGDRLAREARRTLREIRMAEARMAVVA